MPALPNLYLKWHVFRELVGDTRPDAQIAQLVFGPKDSAVRFHRLLHGDSQCEPDVAEQLVKEIVNPCVRAASRTRSTRASDGQLTASDLHLPLLDFIRRVLTAAGGVDADALERAHRVLLSQLAPRSTGEPARLFVEHFAPPQRLSNARSFASSQPSGGDGPPEFRAGRDRGRLLVEGVTSLPSCAYVHFVRDPASTGRHLWDLKWGDTVLWQPSPLLPMRNGQTLALMQEPEPFKSLPGRFVATAVLVLEEDAQGDLDPRGADSRPGTLDEHQTARYLTNVRRLAKRRPSPVLVASTDYIVA